MACYVQPVKHKEAYYSLMHLHKLNVFSKGFTYYLFTL
jgi:hypothetical protein